MTDHDEAIIRETVAHAMFDWVAEGDSGAPSWANLPPNQRKRVFEQTDIMISAYHRALRGQGYEIALQQRN